MSDKAKDFFEAFKAGKMSRRFAPPLLVLLPLSLYFQELGLTDTYAGLIWVYQLIALPLILWIVRGYFEDVPPDIEYAYRVAGHSWRRTFIGVAIPLARPGIAAAGLLAFIFCLGAGANEARIVSNQWLGDQSHIAMDFAGKLLVAVTHAPIAARVGESVRFGVSATELHIFDAATTAAVSHGLEAA